MSVLFQCLLSIFYNFFHIFQLFCSASRASLSTYLAIFQCVFSIFLVSLSFFCSASGTLSSCQAPFPHFLGTLSSCQAPFPHFLGTLSSCQAPFPHFLGTFPTLSRHLFFTFFAPFPLLFRSF